MIISIIIPCYNSENTIEIVVSDIKQEFKKHSNYEYEIFLVNDSSPDKVWTKIQQLCKEDKNIIGLNLSRNFGQASAKLAPLNYVSGDILVYMDDDGQHPVNGIFQLVKEIENGNDVVYAHFPQKQHSLFKKIVSITHSKIAEMMGTKPRGIHVSSFTAWSKLAIETVKNYHSPFPSAGSYLYTVTTKISNIDVEHKTRLSGKSNYTLKKLFSLWLTSFTNFSIVPLRFSACVGVFSAIIGMLYGVFIILRKIFDPTLAVGFATTTSLILFIGGIIMMMLGLIGEYIGRIYMTLSGMTQYKIRTIINREEKK